jgi:hypothetical protein
MIKKLISIERCYGMEMIVEKISKENFTKTNPSHNKDRPKSTGECEVF